MNKFLILVLALPLFGFNCTGPVDDNNGQIDQCLDCDGDHYCGNPTAETIAADICEPTPDCNDRAPGINPGMPELCANGLDDNCDGQIDEDCDECTDDREGSACSAGTGICLQVGQWLCPANAERTVCSAVAGTPVTEICTNGLDDDCDGSVDEGCVIECTDPRIGQQCSNGIGVCQRSGVWQCTNNNVSCSAVPGTSVTEICGNNLDDDCDGQTDESCPTGTTWYRDADGDTFGCQTSVSASCLTQVAVNKPDGYVANSTDCNDAAPSPTNNCTGTIWYQDVDTDGFGCQTSVSATCRTQVSVGQPAGYVANSSDCNDAAYSATNQCQIACIPPNGGTLRVDLSTAVKNSCQNSVIIVWWPDTVINGIHYPNVHLSALNASSFSEWANFTEANFVRTNLLCNVTNVQDLIREVQEPIGTANRAEWWNYGSVYSSWPSAGSDLSNFGVTMTFDGVPMSQDTVLSTPSGSVGTSYVAMCPLL